MGFLPCGFKDRMSAGWVLLFLEWVLLVSRMGLVLFCDGFHGGVLEWVLWGTLMVLSS